MKILHVITSLGTGGAEKLLVDMLPRLRDMGCDVELLVFDGTPTPFMQRLQDSGIVVHRLHAHGGVYSPMNVALLMPYMRRYDVIHTHNTACQLYVPMAHLLAGGKAKLVTTEHSTYNRRRDKWYFKPIDRWMYDRYSAIASVSDKSTRLLCDYIGTDRVMTVENGIDIGAYADAVPADRQIMVPDYKEHDVVVTMVAGFREAKDQDSLIRAISVLPDNYKLCLVGDGMRRSEIEALVASLGMQGRVRLMGVRSDVAQILKASDVNVLLSHWEGLSLSSVEGMASGRPFVASDVDGLREVVGGNGVLFSDGDYRQLADVLQHLMTDKAEYARVSKACVDAAKRYDIAVTARRYYEIYNTLCQRN